MTRFPLVAMVGLFTALSAAHADTIVVQTGPTSPYTTPAFERMVDMCATMGFDCSVPDASVDPDPFWSPEAQADAAKQLAAMEAEWADYPTELGAHYETLPAPHMLFGWNAPRAMPWPHDFPRGFPRTLPHSFGNLFPSVPNTLFPNGISPRLHGFADLPNAYTTPQAGAFPRHVIPRGQLIPWPSH